MLYSILEREVMFNYNHIHFFIFSILFITEVAIALFIHDQFIRPYLGDYLVIFLLYYFTASFVKTKPTYIIIGILLFSYFIEMLQYLNIVDYFQIKNKILRIVIGNTFSYEDLIIYTLAGISLYLIKSRCHKK